MSSDNVPVGKMNITLQIGGFFFALANVICVLILAGTYLSVRHEPKTIEVKGSAKKEIQSDLITWSGTIVSHDPDLVKAYDKLKHDADDVAQFLKSKGVGAGEITFSSITTDKVFAREVVPQAPAVEEGKSVKREPLLMPTQKVESYNLTQTITIESKDMRVVPEVARSVTSLIKDGVEIDSGSPRFVYTQLSELKINMLADASKDATLRAQQVVANANGKLGKLVEARMGVMQVNPKGSSATSSEGNNDTTSYEKEITAIVTAKFELD